ncbi:MAG: glycosyltransferase family 39 protein [Anaerolineae bacterium]|nr:glycosyltransferase family 39 protein [Anaerolineae bacterium]
MNRRIELGLITGILLLAAVLRLADLTHLPPGFSDDELAYINITAMVREGDVAVFYQVGDGEGRAGLYGILNGVLTGMVGDGLLGYRMLPFLGGMLTLALGYALARRMFDPTVALIALGSMAINLRLIMLARTSAAEALVPAAVLLVALALVTAFHLRREIQFHTPGTVAFALLGLLLGTTGYLHYSTLLLGPLVGVFFAHLIFTRQPLSRRVWNTGIFVIVLATIVALPFLMSLLRDTTLSEPHIVWRLRPQNVRDLVDGALHAISGVLWEGDPRVTHSVDAAPLLGPVLTLLMLAGVFEALKNWRDPRYALLLLLLLAGLLTDTWIGVDATFSANLVALTALPLLIGVGVSVILRTLRMRGLRSAWQPVAVGLVLILGVNVVVLRDRLFNDWAHDDAVYTAYHAHLGHLARYLDDTPDGLPVSLCATRMFEPGPAGLSPRATLGAMMHREGLAIRHSDCRGGLVLINAGAPMRVIFAGIAHRDAMPPELHEWLVDGVPLAIDGLPEGSVLRVDVAQRVRDSGGVWSVLAPVSFMPDANGPGSPAEIPVSFEDQLTFAGYDPRVLDVDYVAGGAPIVLVTYWRVDGDLPPDLGIFTHLQPYPDVAPDGAANDAPRIPLLEPWTEANTIDVVPAELQPRDFFVQVSQLPLAANTTPAEYALTVGAYDGTVTILDQHLAVLDTALDYAPHGDRLLIANLTISAPPPVEEPDADGAE